MKPTCAPRLIAMWLAVLTYGCGGAVAGDASRDAAVDVTPSASPRCFAGDPTSTVSCPSGTLCNYAWGGGVSAVECTAFPAECASDRSCQCLLAHPPPPAGNSFCGGRYCDIADSGALVLVCAPD